MSAQIKHLTVEPAEQRESPNAPGGVVERSIALAFAFAESVIDTPELLLNIPDKAVLVLVPSDDAHLAHWNTFLGDLQAARGRRIATVTQTLGPAETTYHLEIDLRDATWGTDPRPEFGGRTAATMRALFQELVRCSQEVGPVPFAYGNIVVLNGVRIAVEEEIEPGRYRVAAIDRMPS